VTTDIQLGLLWNSQIKLSLRNESVWTNLSQWMQTKSGALLIYQEKRTLHRQRKWCFDRLLRVLSGHNFLNSFGRPCILSLYVNTQVNVGSQLFHWITAQKIFQTQSKKLTPTHRDREFSLVINSTPEGYLIGTNQQSAVSIMGWLPRLKRGTNLMKPSGWELKVTTISWGQSYLLLLNVQLLLS
jgi:hypothetical protein